MQALGQPQYPPHEELHPQIDACITHPQLWVIPNGFTEPVLRPTEVVRRHNAEQTYQLIDGIAPRELSHGGPVWGYLYVAVVLPRRAHDLIYQEPTAETVQRVVIKKFFRAVVDEELRQGSGENPYKEVYRMQSIGDNFHVLGCIEALQDERYLYIIAPYCARKSLLEYIPLQPFPNTATTMEAHARELFRQILQDVEYLHERHAICHRDIDPGNFLVSSEGRVMLNDLAMSIVFPPNCLVHPLPRCGKPPYWEPEILSQRPWYPKQCDLWACVVTLFNLLTGERLYYLPGPQDVLFRYCIMARGLSRQFGTNEMVSEVLGETTVPEFLKVSKIAQKIMTLSPQVLELFERTLALRPDRRWTREQVLECDWMTMPM
jgi:serine/threonine protein kinase